MNKIHITLVPKQVGQLWDQLLQGILNDVCSPPVKIPNQSLVELIPHKYHPQYNIHHGKCYKQYTPNLCGYHATFNTLCFVNFIQKGYTNYNLLSGASFWNFKSNIEEFLFKIKKQNKLRDQWPWRQIDIKYGDFQRTYNKLCIQKFQDFQVFRQHQAFELYSFTWQFQYKNLLISQDKRRQFNKLAQYFLKYNGKKPLIISFMLGITNHWMCFQAIKVNNEAQYWFFDSFDRDFLDLNHKQIQELIQNANQQRIKLKRQPYSQFFKKNKIIGLIDTQISLKLIVGCLEGRNSIDQYFYNRQFQIFADQLQKYWAIQSKQNQIIATIKEYWYNIVSFFKNPVNIKMFTPQNLNRFYQFIDITDKLRLFNQDSKRVYQMIKKYDGRIKI